MLYDPCTSPLYMLLVLFLHYFQFFELALKNSEVECKRVSRQWKSPQLHTRLSVQLSSCVVSCHIHVHGKYVNSCVCVCVCVWITFFHCIDLLALLLSSQLLFESICLQESRISLLHYCLCHAFSPLLPTHYRVITASIKNTYLQVA